MTLKALIWDVDGTLAETEEAHRAAFNRTFSARGLDWEWDWDKYRDLLRVTGGVERMTHYVRTERPDALPDDAMVETVHAMHKQKTAEYVAALQRGELPLRPGVARLLAEARDAGMRLAIATTTSAPNISALLDHSPDPVRLDWFEVVGAGGVIPNKKPAPDIYLWTLERLGLSGADCLAMEDSRNGLDSATAAAVPAVITTSSYTRD
ncbi:MAG: HAD-IA family hydrolase, partial [Proteobacteria bacterium]|nr:HAD-IA family hydrolase [Pseudomonadota bacterium]